MLRVDLTGQELSRLRIAERTDPLWETALSLHLLQSRDTTLVFEPWRREVAESLRRAGLLPATRALMHLCPAASYFPDFLTPGCGDADLDTALERIMATPRRRLLAELTRLYHRSRTPVPRGVRLLAQGRPEALARLGRWVRDYYTIAVEPYTAAIRAEAAVDRAVRAEAVLHRGTEGLLTGFGAQPGWRYESGTLRTPYPLKRELRLHGRVLTLVPAFFCVRAPLALVDETLPQVLVYPLSPAPGWLERSRHGGPASCAAQLIGASRARLLELLDGPMTTTGMAAALDLAPSTTSRHLSVLREAGLLVSRREGMHVLHHRTRLGEALLAGTVR
ncbi:ArsR/SmtB family transcription factor [Streptomyces sp. NPDC007264]|uniref:ArsR/SmtB family transcription factor n=1 Tax=Streptomyces sp. NPDC007264 TaxID=3364777 RepID=UPI0036DCD604